MKKTTTETNGHNRQAPGAVPQPKFELLAISEIAPSPTNPRTHFDEAKLAELADSINRHGIRQPILVRPTTKIALARYEIVAGERRFRAAKLAKHVTVPALVEEMGDEQVLELQIVENLQREDVHPLDEATGYKHLLAVVAGMTAKELAARVGKTPAYVAQRLSLNTLIEPAAKDFREGRISLGHATQIARLAAEVQPKALDACYGQEFVRYDSKLNTQIYKPRKDDLQTVEDLRRWINSNVALDLAKAPWSLEDPSLVPDQGPCSTCPSNTATNALLFPDAAQKAICTNPEGYERKMVAWISRQEEKLKTEGAAKVLRLTDIWSVDANDVRRHNLPAGSLGRDAYEVIEKKGSRCDFALPGVFVQGTRRGQTAWVCAEPKCKDHKGRSASRSSSSSASSSAGTGQEKTPAERKQFLARKQELFDARVAEPVRRRVLGALYDKIVVRVLRAEGRAVRFPLDRGFFARAAWAHFELVPTDTQGVMYEALRWDDVTKLPGGYGNKKVEKARAHFDALDDPGLVAFMFLCSVAHLGENIDLYAKRNQSEIVKLAAEHGVPYNLFDARERFAQSPAKKFHGVLQRHVLEVLSDPKTPPPVLYTDKVTQSKGIGYDDLKQQVERKVTLLPYLDGPEGVVRLGARAIVVRGDHAGMEGQLLDAGNYSGGVTCKVELDGGKSVQIVAGDLLYAEPAGAPRKAVKARKAEPAKARGAKAARKPVPVQKSAAAARAKKVARAGAGKR
jgi:ParB family chromosome partitioning protein